VTLPLVHTNSSASALATHAAKRAKSLQIKKTLLSQISLTVELGSYTFCFESSKHYYEGKQALTVREQRRVNQAGPNSAKHEAT